MTPPPPASLPIPREKTALPPAPPGYHWRRSGAGYELRQTVIEHGKRRHIYRGHLSQSIHQQMKESGRYDASLADWVKQRIARDAA
jgi:hypothetical protein